MDMSFLYSHKPVLYPLIPSDYDFHINAETDVGNAVKTLVTLCCRKIVQVDAVLHT